MKAIQYNRPGKLNYIEKNRPKIGEAEILLEVHYAGICGTDIHIMSEESPAAKSVILGHEFSGKVIAVGDKVKHIRIGEAVAIDPNNYCGHCSYCQRGQVQFCENLTPIGVFQDGGWAKYCRAPAKQAYTLPKGVPLVWGALCEPLSCILHGWDRIQPIDKNAEILLIGSGIIGLLWGLLLNHFGYQQLTFSEISENRRKTAQKLGFSARKALGKEADLNRDIPSFDLIIDCSGNPKAIQTAIERLKPGGKFLFFGVCPKDEAMKIKPFDFFIKELTFYGSVINPFTFSRAVEILPHIQVPIENLGVKFFQLDDYHQAIKDVKSGNITKAMFHPKINQNNSLT